MADGQTNLKDSSDNARRAVGSGASDTVSAIGKQSVKAARKGNAAAAGTGAGISAGVVFLIILLAVIFVFGILCAIPSIVFKAVDNSETDDDYSGYTAETMESSYSQWSSECSSALTRIQGYAEEQIEKKIERLKAAALEKYNREHPDSPCSDYSELPNASSFDEERTQLSIVSNAVSQIQSKIPYVICYYSFATEYGMIRGGAKDITDDGTDNYINTLLRKINNAETEDMGLKDILVAYGAAYIDNEVNNASDEWLHYGTETVTTYYTQNYVEQSIVVYVKSGEITSTTGVDDVSTGDGGAVITSGMTQTTTKAQYTPVPLTVYVKGDRTACESEDGETYESDIYSDDAEPEEETVPQQQKYELIPVEDYSSYRMLADGASVAEDGTISLADGSDGTVEFPADTYYVPVVDESGNAVMEDCEMEETETGYYEGTIPDMLDEWGDEWPTKLFRIDLYDIYDFDSDFPSNNTLVDNAYMSYKKLYVYQGNSNEDASQKAADRVKSNEKLNASDYDPYTNSDAADDMVNMLQEAGIATTSSFGLLYSGSYGTYSVTGGDALANYSCEWFDPSNGHGDQLLEAYCLLISAGYTRPAACGILANAITESGFSGTERTGSYWGVFQIGTTGQEGQLGIYSVQNYCSEKGLDYTDPVAQVKWLIDVGMDGYTLTTYDSNGNATSGFINHVQNAYYHWSLKQILQSEEAQIAACGNDGSKQAVFCNEVFQAALERGVGGGGAYKFKSFFWPYSLSTSYTYQIMDRKDRIARELYDVTSSITVSAGVTGSTDCSYLNFAIEVAENYDTYYLWGGDGYNTYSTNCRCGRTHSMPGMDCSGFVSYCLQKTGYFSEIREHLFYTSDEYSFFYNARGWSVYRLTNSTQLQAGDILFYNNNGSGHTEIYAGTDGDGNDMTVGAHQTPYAHRGDGGMGYSNSNTTVESSVSLKTANISYWISKGAYVAHYNGA